MLKVIDLEDLLPIRGGCVSLAKGDRKSAKCDRNSNTPRISCAFALPYTALRATYDTSDVSWISMVKIGQAKT